MNFIDSNEISKFYIVEGKEFDANTKGVWLDNFFAQENNLKIGDVVLSYILNTTLLNVLVGILFTLTILFKSRIIHLKE